MLYVHRLTLLIIAILITFITQAEAKEVFMEMPSPCYSVEAIKKDKVYLKEDEKACVQVIPKTIIKIDDDVDNVAVYVQGRLWNTQSVNKKDIDLEKIAAAVEEQKKKLEAGLIINNDDAATRRADKAAKNFYAEKYQSILNKEMERIKADTFKIAEKEKSETYPEAAKNNPHSLRQNSSIYIFVSSSMPPNTLRAYVQDAVALKEKNVIIVLRGMIGEPPKIKATAKYVKKLMQKDPACQRKCKVYKARFAIDPQLFEKYQIKEVPAFVYDKNVKAISPDIGRGTENKNSSEHYKLSGDVSLEYALELFRRETKEKELEKLISKLRLEYGSTNN